MRLVTLKLNNAEVAGVKAQKGAVLAETINAAGGTSCKTDRLSMIQAQDTPRAFEIKDGGMTRAY